MSKDKVKAGKQANLQCKINMYCIHRLLMDNKRIGMPDKKLWEELKNLFQSADYNLTMELRNVEQVWGDTSTVDQMLKEKSERFIEKKTKPS